MKKIENRKELNAYFKQVNTEIDKYVNEHKIKPSRLSKYIKSNGGVSKFVKDLGLSDVSGINKVVDQALKSRLHMEKDGILKFESFRLLENVEFKENETSLLSIDVIFNDLEISNIAHEKILADYFDTSLGHIEELDAEKHKYTVNTMSGKYESIVFTADELLDIQNSIDGWIIGSIPKTIKIKITEDESVNIQLNQDFYYNDLDYKLINVICDVFEGYKSSISLPIVTDVSNENLILYKTI